MIKTLVSTAKWGATLFVAALATSAIADDFPGAVAPGGLKAATDGPNVTACWNDSGSAPTELTEQIDYLDGVTLAIVAEMGSCDESSTDMLFDDDLTDPSYLGMATCLKLGGDFAGSATATDVECDVWEVQINPSLLTSACGSSSSYKRALWCHESGHGMGLGHENNCMATGCITSNTYSAHHLSHLGTL
jgi:hypothetical protein